MLMKKQKFNYKTILLVIFAFFLIYIGKLHYQTTIDEMNINSESQKYIKLLEEENKKKQSLNSKLERANSDKAIEEEARTKLGYLKPNEILIVDGEKK